MSARRSIQDMIEFYNTMVTGLKDEEGADTEVVLALMERDALEEAWPEMTEAQRQMVQATDDILMQKRQIVVDVMANRLSADRRHWWWFLDEGPQVRDQAGEAA